MQYNVLKRLRMILLLHSHNGLHTDSDASALRCNGVAAYIVSGHQIHHFIVHVCVNIRSDMVVVVSFKMSSIDVVGHVPCACSKLCSAVPLLQSGVSQTG